MAESELKIVDAQPGVWSLCTWNDVIVCVWRSQANGRLVQQFADLCRAMTESHPSGVSVVHLTLDGVALPDADARRGFVQLMNGFSRQIACIAVVVGGTGFWASALRGVVTGMWLAVPQPFAMGMFGSAEEVTRWLPRKHLQRTGLTLDATELARALTSALAS